MDCEPTRLSVRIVRGTQRQQFAILHRGSRRVAKICTALRCSGLLYELLFRQPEENAVLEVIRARRKILRLLTGCSGFKSAHATFAPVAAKASAMLLPFPDELPVTRATMPSLGPGAAE